MITIIPIPKAPKKMISANVIKKPPPENQPLKPKTTLKLNPKFHSSKTNSISVGLYAFVKKQEKKGTEQHNNRHALYLFTHFAFLIL